MNTTYITENDRNGKARYYRVTDGKKKVVSRAEYEANTCKANNEISDETPAVETFSAPEIEENAQIAFEETMASADTSNDSPMENIVLAAEADGEPIRKDLAYDVVKGIVKETGSKHSEKMYLQNCKKCATINYRNCTVCSLIFNERGEVSAVKFMGTTPETRKKMSVYELNCLGDLSKYENNIAKQIEFIDNWYASASKKNDKAS